MDSIPNGKVCIGQGFRGKSLDAFGVGNCTKGCSMNVPGCPPMASAIRDKLENL
jgi:hypothetical protein